MRAFATFVCFLCTQHLVHVAALPDGFKVLPGTPVDASVSFRLALTQRNLATLDALAVNVSTPSSPSYGQYLSPAAVAAVVRPDPLHLAAVAGFLNAAGASWSWSAPCMDFAYASMGRTAAEAAFGVKFVMVEHERAPGRAFPRALEQYDIPAELSGAVRAVDGVTLEAGPDAPPRRRTFQAEPGVTVTPTTLHKQYGIPTSSPSASKASMAVAEFEQAYFYPNDLAAFQKQYGFADKALTKIVGKNKPDTGYLGECSLDVEYITTVAPGVSTWMFSLSQFDLVAWAQSVANQTDAPLVHSISWGSPENGFDPETLASVNTEFKKLATMGFTVLVASGDQGTGHSGLFRCGTFLPNFPASSPWVTAVGGTYIGTDGTETGWPFSGGGFSDTFAAPSYQAQAITTYKAQPGLPSQTYWNSSGRAIPDVSAASTNFEVLIQGELGPISGTSAATPTFAGVLAYINGERLAAGKPALGFVNPLLYTAGSGFTDIVAGNNKSPPCDTGFPATKGFDAITGLGTPVYTQLAAALA